MAEPVDVMRLRTAQSLRAEIVGEAMLYPPSAAREWPAQIAVPVRASGDRLDRLARLEAKLDALTAALDALIAGLTARGSL